MLLCLSNSKKKSTTADSQKTQSHSARLLHVVYTVKIDEKLQLFGNLYHPHSMNSVRTVQTENTIADRKSNTLCYTGNEINFADPKNAAIKHEVQKIMQI